MWISHRKEIRKLTFRALALRRNRELSTWHADNNGFTIGSSKAKANRQWTEVIVQLSRRLWGGTCDKPKNVCVASFTVHLKKTFDRWFTSSIVNFTSSLWTWEFHYRTVDEMVKVEKNLEICAELHGNELWAPIANICCPCKLLNTCRYIFILKSQWFLWNNAEFLERI